MIGAMIAGVGAGVAGGLGAWIFRLMIGLVHNLFFLGRLDAAYDANVHTPPSPWGAAVVLVPVVGGVGVVYLVRRFGPEVEGGGVPEVLGAITARSGEIRPSVAAVKSAASALSIGSGGSVGREGPIIQIGAAFGSALARVGRLSVADRRLLVAAGAAAGIAATFNAPFGALLFAVELLLVAISPRVMLVIGTAVVTAVLVARTLIGSGRAFTVLDLHQVDPISIDWSEGLALAALGLVIGVVSAGLIRGLGWAQDRFEGRPHHPYLAHAAAMVAVGLGMYGFFSWIGYYSIQGVGYATITDVLEESVTSPWILLALAAAKLAATTLTLSSGGSGGIFSPALFLGATLGGALGHALVAVGVDVDPVVLALGGMAGAVAGTTGALLTAVMMVTEMTGDLGALLPLLIVVVVAGPIRQRLSPATLYVSQLERRGYPLPGDRGAGDEADG
jgi:CIC family chloride channel protein